MRVAADGYIDIRDGRRVRTPGLHEEAHVDPMPEAEALSFLLSHSFPGHRRMVRSLSVAERRRIRLAAWSGSVSERMALVDRVWRSVTEPVVSPQDQGKAHLVQVIQYGAWAYPLHLDGPATRVLPTGGVPAAEVKKSWRAEILRMDRKTA
jgi:hypothetical protein